MNRATTRLTAIKKTNSYGSFGVEMLNSVNHYVTDGKSK